MIRLSFALMLIALLALSAWRMAEAAPQAVLQTHEGDYIARDFRFDTGAVMPELRLHYTTLGTPRRDAQGRVTNAVLILHGTGGSGHQFIRPQFSGVLFVPGGLLDAQRYFIILPDGIGHGRSSKPSDGLHAKFPEYDYRDMVAAQYRLVTDGLGIDHLRLVMGTSMGCMHSFMWGEAHPDFMDALMPLACLPVQIAGRNRIWRKMILDDIREDPAWDGGDYKQQPLGGLRAALDILIIAGSAPLPWQLQYPTRDAADAFLAKTMGRELDGVDANDLWYQVNASRDYDPSASLEQIKMPVMWINSGDDFINPPELGIAQHYAVSLKRGRFVLLPASKDTHGHGTHTWAALWQDHLKELLDQSAVR